MSAARPRVAVIGSGISGLACAWSLRDACEVTLFEAAEHFGGHSHTVDVTLPGPAGPCTYGVDTGFLVFNPRTYPRLVELFDELGVLTIASDMSFSVQVPDVGLEWSGSDLDTVFAQRANLWRPAFWGMLRDILRFNRLATRAAEQGKDAALREPVGDFLARHRFGAAFRDWYFLPMIGCIWSCPTDQMLRFPVGTMIRFCHNHGLLQLQDRPQWYTVTGGSREYVRKMVAQLPDARLRTPVHRVRRLGAGAGVALATADGGEHFDEVVFACHADQALALLEDATSDERRVLGRIRYRPNRAVLHTDTAVLPRCRKAWAAWNYERAAQECPGRTGAGRAPRGRAGQDEADAGGVCLHYLLNRLQPLPFSQPVIVTLNPAREPSPSQVLREFEYAHPVFDQAAIDAQREVPALQGRVHSWYCGAWTGYGFHEDGLRSGLEVARGVRGCYRLPGALPLGELPTSPLRTGNAAHGGAVPAGARIRAAREEAA